MSSSPHVFVVLKFGGTSVANPRRWRHIARLVKDNITRGAHPVVVCSAIAGVTNALEKLVAEIAAGEPPDARLRQIWSKHEQLATALGLRAEDTVGEDFAALTRIVANLPRAEPSSISAEWRARILAFGELMSTRVGAAWLEQTGVDARWVDARTLLAATAEPRESGAQAYLSARCDACPNEHVQARLTRGGRATITQGFIARNNAGETVLLGRGGSDTSAAYLAATLDAARLEIWTDVPGLFTTDPRRSADARLLTRVSYDEAAVLGALGATVLHPRCLPPVQARGIPLSIRWTDHPDVRGTVIAHGSPARGIKAVTSRHDLCLIRTRRGRRWQPIGFMAEVSACFHAHALSMDLISSSPSEIRATVDMAANPGAEARLPELLADLRARCEPSLTREVACVSIVGTRISEELPRIADVMRLLGEPRVHLVSHAADDTHVSYVLDAEVGASLVTAVHTAIFANARKAGAFGPSWRDLRVALGGAPPTAAPAPPTPEVRV